MNLFPRETAPKFLILLRKSGWKVELSEPLENGFGLCNQPFSITSSICSHHSRNSNKEVSTSFPCNVICLGVVDVVGCSFISGQSASFCHSSFLFPNIHTGFFFSADSIFQGFSAVSNARSVCIGILFSSSYFLGESIIYAVGLFVMLTIGR